MAEKKDKVKIICEQCKSIFSVHPYRKNTAKYCSYGCGAKDRISGWNKGSKNTWYNPKGLTLGHGWNKGTRGVMKANKTSFKKDMKPWNYEGKSTVNKLDRTKFEREVLKLVLIRDKYTCQLCGIKEEYMHVDHIQPFSEYVEGRFDMNNCRTLCRPCHYKITFNKEIPSNSRWGIKPRKVLYV